MKCQSKLTVNKYTKYHHHLYRGVVLFGLLNKDDIRFFNALSFAASSAYLSITSSTSYTSVCVSGSTLAFSSFVFCIDNVSSIVGAGIAPLPFASSSSLVGSFFFCCNCSTLRLIASSPSK